MALDDNSVRSVSSISPENSKHNISDTVSKTSQMKRKGQGHVILCDIGWTLPQITRGILVAIMYM